MHARNRLAGLPRWILVGALTAVLAPACGDDEGAPENRSRAQDASAGDAAFSAGDGRNGDGRNGDGDAGAVHLTDDEIAGVMFVTNLIEVEQGELARERASAPAVRAFAGRMVQEHAAANRALIALIETTSLELAGSALEAELAGDAERATQTLRTLSPPDFDVAYLHGQRLLHARVLSLIDEALLPSVVNPLLESELLDLRGGISAHLLEAGRLLDGLASADAR